MIVLAPKWLLSEAELLHEWLPMPLTRVRGTNATDERYTAIRSEPGHNRAENQRPND